METFKWSVFSLRVYLISEMSYILRLSVERVNPYSSHLQALCFSLLFTMPKMVVIGRCRLVPGITCRQKTTSAVLLCGSREGEGVGHSRSFPGPRAPSGDKNQSVPDSLDWARLPDEAPRAFVRVLEWVPFSLVRRRGLFSCSGIVCGKSAEKAPIMSAHPIRRPSCRPFVFSSRSLCPHRSSSRGVRPCA